MHSFLPMIYINNPQQAEVGKAGKKLLARPQGNAKQRRQA